MTDVTSAKKKIQVEEVDYRSAVSESTFTKMAGSVNWIIDNSTFALGTIVASMLTLAQFQSELNSTWVLMNGDSVVGSDYETLTGNSNVPDMFTDERFLRQATNDGALGATQVSANLSHTHLQNEGANISTFGTVPMKYQSGGSGSQTYTEPGFGSSTPGSDRVLQTVPTNSSGGSESRPNNMQVNHFIKINL